MAIELVKQTKTGNFLVTVAIGEEYFQKWAKIILPSWVTYAENNDLGIAVVTQDLLPKNDPSWKKPNWQKLLLPNELIRVGVERACYLDTDILINPFSPNVFDSFIGGKIGVTSIRTGMPYSDFDVQKRLAYLRHSYIDSTYPLDSALFFSTKQLFEYHGFPDQMEEFCSGFMLFSPAEQVNRMNSWFSQYDSATTSITNGGEQTHLNFHVLNENLATFLPYKFQAIWAYEAAWNYPELFKQKFSNSDEVKRAINNALLNNYFLHFAGASRESNVIWDEQNFNLSEFLDEFTEFNQYSKQVPKAPAIGTSHAG